MADMRILGIRHTRILVPPGVCYGRTDYPVTDSFEAEIAALRSQLPTGISHIWSSPATRCRRTAGALSSLAAEVDPRLQELNFGAWEGREWESFRGPESEAWAEDPWRRSPPEGESGAELEARVGEFRNHLSNTISDREGIGVVVTHAGVLRVWRGLIQGMKGAEVMKLEVPFGEIWELG